jgi:hypothetical protein
LVAISTPAIEPAISIRPVKNQLIANVSRVPNVRQLMALRTDLVCVSAPRNKVTRRASLKLIRHNLTRDTWQSPADDMDLKIGHGLGARLRAVWLEVIMKTT